MRKHLYFGFIVVLIILSLTVLFGEIRNGSIKSSENEYGYLLTEIAGVKQDEKNGKWIVYESKNNEDCIKNGVCPAINKVKLKNGDSFTFELKKF